MKVLGVAGSRDAGRESLVETLVERLSARGRVGVVTDAASTGDRPSTRQRPAGTATSYALADDGDWVATGGSLTPDDALERLAPTHDYALIEGFPDGSLPTVAVGEVEAAEPVVATATDAGAVDVDALLDRVADLEPYETLPSLVAKAKRAEAADRAGAIATFTGRVRRRDGPDDRPTEHLAFEKYDGVADERMAEIRADLLKRDGVHEVLLHHRTGVVEAGEDIVFVVVLAGHRPEAFRTVEDGIDRLKDEVPFFKKEVTVEDEFWRHEEPEP